MDEFSFIKACLAPLAGPEGLGLLDDAALMTPRAGYDLVLTKDTMVEGVHFPNGICGADTAGKLLRVNLSDLAAKGATPVGYLLSIAWPESWPNHEFEMNAKSFATGLKAVQAQYGFALYGGDTVKTSGPMVVTATLIGEVPAGRMVKRSGANEDDDIWVSGTVGDAYLGLQTILSEQNSIASIPPDAQAVWTEAYWRPTPRLALTELLRDYATSSVDISDGLIADIGHIAKASGLGIAINIDNVPLSNGAKLWAAEDATRDSLIKLITGGDDYEIAFTAAPKDRAIITEKGNALGVPLTRIGACISGDSVACFDSLGKSIRIDRPGYSHF
ncbi:MAG: thiamine-phosphate kinase [Alphaproteobacteria bacterium]